MVSLYYLFCRFKDSEPQVHRIINAAFLDEGRIKESSESTPSQTSSGVQQKRRNEDMGTIDEVDSLNFSSTLKSQQLHEEKVNKKRFLNPLTSE